MSPFIHGLGRWALLLLPALVIFAVFSHLRGRREVDLWGGRANLRALGILPSAEADLFRRACLWGALALTSIAFARPQWGEVAETVQKLGMDVVILMDTSRSMAVTDIAPSRLERARLETKSFLATVEGDRTGLVAFAGVPVTLSPLTEDSGAIGMLLDISDPELIPAQGTDMGKALVEAIRLLPQPHDRDQVILLVSDGEDQGKDSLAAARMAARLGIHLFCIGVGTPGGSTVPGLNGKPMIDPATAATALSRLDEKALGQIASITDGRYWTLAGAGSVIPQIREEMGRLKRKEYASRSQAMRQDQFHWFLIPALGLLLSALLLPDRKRVPPGAASAHRAVRAAVGAGILALSCQFLVSPALHAQSVHKLAQSAHSEYLGGKYESALTLYRNALQSTTSPAIKPRLHFNAGTCLLALQRPQEAQEELALALAGADPLVKGRALYNLAKAFYAGGDRSRSLSTLRALLVAEPENRDAQLLYEWILRQKPPEQPPTPPPPPNEPPPPQVKPPDVLEQLPMPPPRELQDQMKPPEPPVLGMKPW